MWTLDIQKYRTFLLVAEYENLTRVAEETGYTQSGVSQIVKGLESEFGFTLLHRHRRGVSLTEEAKLLLPSLRELIKWNESLNQIVASVNGMEIGNIRVGSITSVSVHWLPRILKRFSTEYPQISVKLQEGGDWEVAEWIGEGLVDFGFSCDRVNQSFEWLPLVTDDLLAVLPYGHPLENEAAFPIAAFNAAPFVMMPRDYHMETYGLMEKHGVTPDIRFHATDDHTTVAMVEQGLGLSVLSKLAMQAYPHRKVRTLALDPPCPRTLGIVLRNYKTASPAAGKFIECAKKVMCGGDDDR